jgi:hypothetical protein
VQGGGEQDATEEPHSDVETGEFNEGEFDAGEFVIDHDAEPPEAVEPTTS